TTSAGTRQTTSGNRVDVHFVSPAGDRSVEGKKPAKRGAKSAPGGGKEASEIEPATVDGDVVLTQPPPARPGETPLPLRATAERAEYEGAGEWLHLTGNPHVDDAG